jgi:hypothetical protein
MGRYTFAAAGKQESGAAEAMRTGDKHGSCHLDLFCDYNSLFTGAES